MTTKFAWNSVWKQIWHATTPPPPPFAVSRPLPATLTPHPLAGFFSPRFCGSNRPIPLKSPRYVLSRGFASGLFAWSLPSKASETAAVVSSCTSGSTVDRTFGTVNGWRDKKHSKIWIPLVSPFNRRNICSDCRKDGILRMSRRSASSKSGNKGNGNGRPPRREKNGEGITTLRNGRATFSRSENDSAKAQTAEARSTDSKRNEDQEYEPKGDEEKPKSLATAAAAIAKRAARDHGFMDRLPQMHRPSKEELLAAASSFWDRLRIRFKWLTIRQIRPFNMDEISAFFSWIVLGHLAWIVLGTTTFFSLAIWLVNTVFAQEYLAKLVGNYLTKEMGMKVVFESAIVPRWKDGCISFKNVFLSRRPGPTRGQAVEKGSSSVAAAVAAATAYSEDQSDAVAVTEVEEDTNYTQYDLTIETVNVTISLAKWMNGRGLLVNVDMKGIRGVIDRTHVHFDSKIDPRSFRHEHKVGDFELDSFKLEDLLVTVHQPGDFRPFSVSIFSCDLPQLRKRWLFYDFLSANHVSGSFDESLFTLHPRQSHGPSNGQNTTTSLEDGLDYPWKKTSRFRIDGLNFDHLNRGVQGPLHWIVAGNLDIIADINFPEDSAEGISKFMHDMMDKMEASVALRREKLANVMSNQDLSYENLSLSGIIGAAVGLTEDQDPVTTSLVIDNDDSYTTAIFHEEEILPTFEEATTPISTKSSEATSASSSYIPPQDTASTKLQSDQSSDDRKFMMIDLHLEMNDVRAAVPLFTHDLSYKNSALMRPIIAFINNQRTIIPINCRLLKRHKEFDGSWTLFDSGLMDDLSAEVHDAFIKDIADADIKRRRMRAVGLWSLQVFLNAFLAAMAGTIIA